MFLNNNVAALVVHLDLPEVEHVESLKERHDVILEGKHDRLLLVRITVLYTGLSNVAETYIYSTWLRKA